MIIYRERFQHETGLHVSKFTPLLIQFWIRFRFRFWIPDFRVFHTPLYHEHLARVIAQALPVFDINLHQH